MEFGHTFDFFAKRALTILTNLSNLCFNLGKYISCVWDISTLYCVIINQYITDFLFDELFEISKISI